MDITAHPFFGPLVQTVSLGNSGVARQDVLRAVEEVEGQDFHECLRPLRIYNKHQAFLYSQQPRYLLERAFSNIRQHNNEVTLGLFDDELREGYGSDRCFGLLRRGGDYHSRIVHYFPNGNTDERDRDDKLVPSSLDLMYKASRLAGVPLRGLTLDCNLDNLDLRNEFTNASRRLQDINLDFTLQEIVFANASSTNLRQDLCLTMKFHDTPSKPPCIRPSSLIYEDGTLRLCNIKVGMGLEAELVELGFHHLGVVADLIEAQPLHQITPDGCLLEVRSFNKLLETSARTLRFLDIRRTKQHHAPFLGSWTHVFALLSFMSLEQFHIEVPEDRNEVPEHMEGIELLPEDSYTADGRREVKHLLAMLIVQLGG